MRHLMLTINSTKYTINSDFENGQVAEAYNELVRNLAVFNQGFAIDLVGFQAMNTIWVLDTTNAQTAGCEYISRPSPNATWSIRAEFGTALPENVQMFVIAETEKQLEIDSNYSVSISSL